MVEWSRTRLVLICLGLGLGLLPLPAAAEVRQAAAALSTCYSSDNGRPTLTDLTVSPRTVDLSAADALVTVRAVVADSGGPGPATGVATVSAYVVSDASTQGMPLTLTRSSDNSWQGQVPMLQGYARGTWRVRLVEVTDGAGLYRQYLPDGLAAFGFAPTWTVAGPADAAKPVLQTLTVSRSRVDVRRGAKTLSVAAQLTDDLGVRRVQVFGGQRGSHVQLETTLARVEGSATSGHWTGTLRVPKWINPGRWRLLVIATDAFRTTRVKAPALKAAGLPYKLRVLAPLDMSRPSLSSPTVSPAVADVRTKPVTVTLTVHASDLGSGIHELNVVATGANALQQVRKSLHRVSGTTRNGTWRTRFVLSPCASRGRWSTFLSAVDGLGLEGMFSAPDALRVRAGDTRRPRATAASPVPSTGPVVVTFNEDVTGISSAAVAVRPGNYSPWQARTLPAAVTGTWSCRAADQAVVDCATGWLRSASFTPDAPLTVGVSYVVEFSPEHLLSVLDRAGYPPLDTAFAVNG